MLKACSSITGQGSAESGTKVLGGVRYHFTLISIKTEGGFVHLNQIVHAAIPPPPAAREIVISRPGYLYLRKRVFLFLLIDLYTSLRHSS